MANEVTDGKTAARELAARLPGWAVWYGEHTQRFWAMPRGAAQPGSQLAEADTIEELEAAVRALINGTQGAGTPAPHAHRPEQMPMAPEQHRQPVGARH
ncbi:hypothetical protein [Sphaerisporangium dianthi]|uniref:Uncharacterized protein n=1 Tax=Sphaerisporangium dianthi TaxID=1436120 RepID=A0ABV9CMI7_9ACTN